MKKWLRCLISVVMIAVVAVCNVEAPIAVAALQAAAGEIPHDACGKELTWTLENGTLTVSGSGAMYDYMFRQTPWYDKRNEINTVVIGQGVTSIGSEAFKDCKKLSGLRISGSVEEIGSSAFEDCSSITKAEIPQGVKTIGKYAFESCENMSVAELSDSVAVLGDKAFQNCTALETVTIGSSLEVVGDNPFCECDQLTDITVSAANTDCSSKDGVLFDKKNMLVSYPAGKEEAAYTVPKGVTEIGRDAFFACKNLVRVKCPDSVVSIGDRAFAFCEVTNVELGENLVEIGSFAFDYCPLTEIKLPDSVTRIGDWAFDNCKLTGVNIGKRVASIGYGSFHCEKAAAFTVDEENTHFSVKDGVLFNYDKTVLVHYPAGRESSVYTVPDGVEEIYGGAFNANTHLQQIHFTDTLQKIGYMAFGYCTKLSGELVIPDSVTEIDTCAFSGCGFDKAVFGNHVVQIGVWSFENCRELKEIYFKGNSFNIADGAFFDVTADAYYPKEDSSWTAETQKSYGGMLKWGTWDTPVAENNNIARCRITLSQTNYIYDGNAKKPDIRVENGTEILRNGTDFVVSYKDNINAGTAKATVTGIGNYGGSVVETYTLKKASQYVSASISSPQIQVKKQAQIWAAGIGKITYQPDRSGCVTVDEEGTVTAVKAGTADITVRAAGDENYEPAENTVTVTVSETEAVKASLETLTYSFSNSRSAFGYPPFYRIPLERYKMFYSHQEAIEWYTWMGLWGGNCFGMSTTAAMFITPGSTLELSGFRSDAKKVSDLKVNDKNPAIDLTVTELNEAMLIAQVSSSIQNEQKRHRDNLDDLVHAVKEVENGAPPIEISIFGTVNGRNSGHAVVGYKLEEISSTTSKLHIYDCNYPGQDRSITLTADRSGSYKKWSYELSSGTVWGSGYANAGIQYCPYETFQSVWAGRTTNRVNDSVNILCVNSDNFELQDAAGNTVAAMENGDFSSRNGEIFEGAYHDIGSEEHIFYMPTDQYRLVNKDDSLPELEAVMVNHEQSVSLETEADSVTFYVDDHQAASLASVDGECGERYTVTTGSDLEYAADSQTITYSGKCNGEETTVGTSYGELFSENYANSGVYVNGTARNFSHEDDRDMGTYARAILSETSFTYDGMAKEPGITVTDTVQGQTLSEGVDYTLVYRDNRYPGTATVEIYGINGYTGKLEETFAITGDAPAPTPVPTRRPAPVEGATTGPKDTDQPQPSKEPEDTSKKGAVQQSRDDGGQQNKKNMAPAKGTILKNTSSKDKYKVVKKGKSVEYKSPGKKRTKATVPSKVKLSGITYKVTGISANAFSGCKKLKKAAIGGNVSAIRERAFYGCKKLKVIDIKTKKLKIVGNKAIKGIHKKAVIKVPKAKQKKYNKLFNSKAGFKKPMRII